VWSRGIACRECTLERLRCSGNARIASEGRAKYEVMFAVASHGRCTSKVNRPYMMELGSEREIQVRPREG